MQSTITASLFALLAATAYALPSPQQNRPGDGTRDVVANIVAHDNPVSDGSKQSHNVTVPFGVISLFNNIQATSLCLVGSSSSVPGVETAKRETVVCRRYLDAYAQQPGSEPFSLGKEALLSTNSVDVQYLLCYTVSESELGGKDH